MLDDKDEFESFEAFWSRRQIERAAEEHREMIKAVIKVSILALVIMLPTIINLYSLLRDIRAGR